jgi:hypothetical protein
VMAKKSDIKEAYKDSSRSLDNAERLISQGDVITAIHHLRAAEYYRGQYDYMTSTGLASEESIALSERARYITRQLEREITGR